MTAVEDARLEAAKIWTKLGKRRQDRAHRLVIAIRKLGGTASGPNIMARAQITSNEWDSAKRDARLGLAMHGGTLVYDAATELYTVKATAAQFEDWTEAARAQIHSRARTVLSVTEGWADANPTEDALVKKTRKTFGKVWRATDS